MYSIPSVTKAYVGFPSREETAVRKIKDTTTVKYNQEKADHTTERMLCGRKHVWNKNKYLAYGKTCSKCGRVNRFAAQCLARNKNPRQQRKNVHAVQDDSECEYVLKIADKNQRQRSHGTYRRGRQNLSVSSRSWSEF